MTEIRSHTIVQRDPADLHPYPFNARKHDDWQIKILADTIKDIGYIDPVIVDETDMVLAGHARVMAAMKANMPLIPTIVVSGLTEIQKRAYVLAANRIAENASWDENLLKHEVGAIFEFNNDFDFSVLGFSKNEIDDLLSSINADSSNDQNDDVDSKDDVDVDVDKTNKTQYQFIIKCDNSSQIFELRDMFNVTRSSVMFDKFKEFFSIKKD